MSWLIVALWSMVIFVTIPLARAIQRFVQKAWGEEVFLYAVLITIIAAFGLTLSLHHGLVVHPVAEAGSGHGSA